MAFLNRDDTYLLVKNLIEQAWESGAKSLDLSGLDLTELPTSIGKCSQLQSLDLSDNQLKLLPEFVVRLTQLRSLNLSSNKLTDIPSSLAQLGNLKELKFSNNPLNPELAAANEEGLAYVKTYLRTGPSVALNEAK